MATSPFWASAPVRDRDLIPIGFSGKAAIWTAAAPRLTIADGNDSTVSIPAYAFNVLGQLDSMYVGYTAGNIGTFTQAASSSVVVITDQMILGTGIAPMAHWAMSS